MPVVSACVSSVQWLLTGEQNLEVNSLTAAPVIITVRFFSRASCCTASAIGVTGRSTTAFTPSESNQRRAMVDATSGLFSVSPCTISIRCPSMAPPASAAAIRAAAMEPAPPASEYGPVSSVSTPTRMASGSCAMAGTATPQDSRHATSRR